MIKESGVAQAAPDFCALLYGAYSPEPRIAAGSLSGRLCFYIMLTLSCFTRCKQLHNQTKSQQAHDFFVPILKLEHKMCNYKARALMQKPINNTLKTDKENKPHKDKSRKHRAAKIVGIACGVLVALLLCLVVGVNVFVRATYSTFYDAAQPQFQIPGINEGFIPQDLDYLDESDSWLFSGYVSKDSPSPLYKRASDGEVSRIYVDLPDGTVYDGHGSGVTSTADYVFLTREGGYLVMSATDVAAAEDGAHVQVIDEVDLEFTPSFMNIESKTLYVGNFYYPEKYETPDEHRITTPDGSKNPAIIYAYPADESASYGFATQAACVYSIRDKVQGTAQTPDGKMVLSCSYGLATSTLSVYDLNKVVQDGTFRADGQDVPLYALDSRSLVEELDAPPMSEGIEGHDGLIYTTDEAASNKYIFGKLYGAGQVYALNLA